MIELVTNHVDLAPVFCEEAVTQLMAGGHRTQPSVAVRWRAVEESSIEHAAANDRCKSWSRRQDYWAGWQSRSSFHLIRIRDFQQLSMFSFFFRQMCWFGSRLPSPFKIIDSIECKARQVFFLCFSLCARIDFRQSAEKKKKCSFRFSVWNPNTKCVSAPVSSTVPSTQSRTCRSTAFQATSGKGYSSNIFSASRFARRCNFQNKKRREKRLPVDGMTARLLIVVIGEGSRVLPEGEPFSFRMINYMRKRLASPMAYDWRPRAHNLCELDWGIVHAPAR